MISEGMIRTKIQKGIDANVMVYDSEDKEEMFTTRLMLALCSLDLSNPDTLVWPIPHTIYLPLYATIDPHIILLKTDIVLTRHLDMDNPDTKRFFDEGACLAPNKKNLGVVEFDNATVLCSF